MIFANKTRTRAFCFIAHALSRAIVGSVIGAVVMIAGMGLGLAKSTQPHSKHGQSAGDHRRHLHKSRHQHVRPTQHHRRHIRTARHHHGPRHPAVQHHARNDASARASILIDADTGEVLSEANADGRAYPASLTKMMTLYQTFAALNKRRLKLDQRLPVSARAARQEPTKLWLKAGDSVRVRNLILGVITRSANDAAVVLAEGIAGTEAIFAKRMTATALRLGMTGTVFRNASGLPDPAQHTTARDVARLARVLYRDFPHEYGYFATRRFNFRGRTITGHNHLLETYEGADGLKTGFIRASGFNLATSAARNGHRLIGVILGSPSWSLRDRQMAKMLDRGFSELGSGETAAAGGDRVLPNATEREAARSLATGGARVAVLPSPAAEAPPLVRRKIRFAVGQRSVPASACGIQLGAFHTRKAASKLAHAAARLSVAEGKAVHILQPAGKGKKRLYRVQLWGFSGKGARSACAKLKKNLPCMVVSAVAGR